MTATPLKRSLGLASLTLYGLGTIIGAGIYVLVGAVAGKAGMNAPLSFLLAGTMAALTGLSYAELSVRRPEAAGAVAYVTDAFSPAMGRIVGFTTLAVALIAAASVARGGIGYLTPILPADITIPTELSVGVLIVCFTLIALAGVRLSVYTAAALSAIEIGGLILVVWIGAPFLMDIPIRANELWPHDINMWQGIGSGAFLAFFAFAGFENMVNMVEEVKTPHRTMPRAIVLSIVVSMILYMLILLIAVMKIPPAQLAQSNAPLCLVVECDRPAMRIFSPIALIATLNGVLIEIVIMARILYGMARRGLLPHFLGRVHSERQTPVPATLVAGGSVLVLAVGFEFETLVRMTSLALLGVFLMVNLALVRFKYREARMREHPPSPAFNLPRWVPALGVAGTLALLGAELMG